MYGLYVVKLAVAVVLAGGVQRADPGGPGLGVSHTSSWWATLAQGRARS